MKIFRFAAIVLVLLGVCALTVAGCETSGSPPGSIDSTGLYPVEVDERWGYIDNTGELLMEPQFEHAADFFEGFASVWLEDGVGFIDTSGNLVYEERHDFSGGVFLVGIGRFSEGFATKTIRLLGHDPDLRLSYIDVAGETSSRVLADGLPFHEGYAAVQTDILCLWDSYRPKQWHYMGTTGAFLAGPAFESAESFCEGLACVGTSGKYGYIDHTGALAIELQFDEAHSFSEGLASVATEGRRGYIDGTGDWIIELPVGTLSRAESSAFSEGLATVWRGELAGYMDTNGKMAIEPQFYGATRFCEGLAAVRLEPGGPWGYIDRDGVLLIQPQYYGVEPFRDGLARVHLADQPDAFAYIDKTGKVIWQGE